MNIRDLKYLVALCEHQHFGKAAESCFVSQPALSMQIKKLEGVLGIKLLERTKKSVLLTEHGQVIAHHAQQILNQVKEMHEIANNYQDPYRGELKIGIFPTLAPYLLPLIIPSLTKKFPNISFYLLEEQTKQLIDKLKAGKIHAIFLSLPITEKNFTAELLFDEEFLLTIHDQHPLATKKSIRQHDLLDKELLLLDEGHCMRDHALAICQQLQVDESKNFRATSLETLRHMVAARVGMTLIPQLACYRNNQITYIPFAKPKPSRTIALVWRKSSIKQPLLQEISDHIRQVMRKQNSVKVRG